MSELMYLEPGLVLIDVQNVDGNGFDLVETVARRKPACPVIGMAVAADTIVAVAALKRGAVDFLVKPIALPALHEAVASAERIMDRCRLIAEQAERDREALERLSQRERQVLACLAAGKTSRSIAEEIGISVRTVEAHRAGLVDKLAVPNAGAAIAVAVRYETGLLAHASRMSAFEA